jgi:RimJ/RimL family protein N-acetyltransferase
MLSRKTPYFVFPGIPAKGELSFEKLSSENFHRFYDMFKSDESPFTDERFKDYEQAKEYVQYIEQYGTVLPKQGLQDWLFLWEGQYAGVLHLYDLSLETFAENDKRCWVGFATKPVLRNKGITKKAFHHFVHYIFEQYPNIKYIHSMTLKENLAAQALLRSLHFKEDMAERLEQEYAFYILQK